MVSTFFDPGVTTADQINPWNNLLGKALQQYNQMTESRYLPQEKEASIFNKRIGPLASLAISPLMEGMDSPQRQQIVNYISQELSRQGQQPGLFGSYNQQQSMSNLPQQSQGPTTGLGHNIAQKFNQRTAAPGSTIVNPQGEAVTTIPTGTTTEGTQAALTAYEELEPRIHAMADLAKKFPGDWTTKLNVAKDKLTSGPSVDPYESFKSLQRQIKPFLKQLNWTDADIDKEIKVHPGEKDYSGRMIALLHRIEDTVKRAKKREGGISLTNEPTTSGNTGNTANKVSNQLKWQKMSTEQLQKMLAGMK